MSVNPYAPPTSPEQSPEQLVTPPVGEVAWFSPGQVGWATFFGTPLAAGLLLRENARAAQDDNGAKVALWGGIGGTILILGLGFFILPDNFPGSVLGIVTALSAHSFTKMQWANRVAAERAPLTAETRRAVKLTLLSMGVVLFVILVAVGVGITLFPDAEIWQE